MGRKNRKGRTGEQNPKRFYRAKREQRGLESPQPGGGGKPLFGLDAGDGDPSGYEAALRDPTGATIGALPKPGQWDAREISHREPAATRTCGRCAEWSSSDGHTDPSTRGQCLHPGSGFSFPPADMDACAFFH